MPNSASSSGSKVAARRKGIILAGGSGTRLYPLTLGVSKQLLPVYDKPMIYYPLSTLMLAGIRDILIIATPDDLPRFQRVLGDGSQWGLSLSFQAQASPDGLPQAFILGADFIGDAGCALVLGDNIFHSHNLIQDLRVAAASDSGATVFAYPVKDPERYGVIELDAAERALSIEEKPTHPRSRYAITGLYFFDSRVVEYAKTLQPSRRGELEITDLIKIYLAHDQLAVHVFGRGAAWLDAGTHETLLEASQFIETIERRQGFKVSCPEEIAWRNRWISDDALGRLAESLPHGNYSTYLRELLRLGP